MFNALYRSILMVWRMLKNAVLRPFRSLYARARAATNLSRQASKLVPKVVKSVTTVKVKPKKREDYIDAGPVYVAKSLIFVVIGVLAAGAVPHLALDGEPLVHRAHLRAGRKG